MENIFEKNKMKPKYPIYIISKGRADSRLTSKALELMNIQYHIVIEQQEYDQYAKYINAKKILVLPFSNLGLASIPARNWVWEHSISIGARRHWILDDNINGFGRLNKNIKIKCLSGSIFNAAEDFVDRYENIAMAGFEYDYFIPGKVKIAPYRLNTRIYSCILLRNDIQYRWRGKYNEDTDLSIRILKDGFCTILFQAFICYKITTQTMSGGNTEELYGKTDRRREFAESLKKQHPDIVKIVWKYNRWHHQVDYRLFKQNKLIRKPGIEIPKGINNYGMILKNIETGEILKS